MVADSATRADLPEMTPEDILEGMGTIKRMPMVGAVFAAVDYLLVGAALLPRGRRRGPHGRGGAER